MTGIGNSYKKRISIRFLHKINVSHSGFQTFLEQNSPPFGEILAGVVNISMGFGLSKW